jgi:hypothetical protein
MLASAILRGRVHHARYRPTKHAFDYSIAQWWLALDELENVAAQSRWFSLQRFAPLWFRRADYMRGSTGDLATAVLEKTSQLVGQPVHGRVFFLGALRTFGLYFSPINCYFIQTDDASDYRYMLAEVSNTPWNERHYYVLDLQQALITDKAFHVSPFNPMDMTYHWQLRPPRQEPAHKCLVHMDCHSENRDFSATMKLTRVELNSKSIRNVLLRYPVNTLGTVAAIYWQALRLFLKRTPLYSHPNTDK